MNNPDINWKITVILMVFTSNGKGIDPGYLNSGKLLPMKNRQGFYL